MVGAHPRVVNAADVDAHEPEPDADVLVGHELEHAAICGLHTRGLIVAAAASALLDDLACFMMRV